MNEERVSESAQEEAMGSAGSEPGSSSAAEKAGAEGAKGAGPSPKRSVSRRQALAIGLGGTAVLLGLGSLRYIGHNPLVHPPGGQSEAHLVDACIRCERCYEACPRHIIVPAHIEDGLLGMRAPTLDFNENYCDSCAAENGGQPLCVQVCPTSALSLEGEELKAREMTVSGPDGDSATMTVQTPDLGLATIDTSQCLAYRDTGCRFCYDACPLNPKAIELYGGTGNTNPRVRVVAANCNGCGACESACVSLKAGSIASGATERAIVVRPFAALEQA